MMAPVLLALLAFLTIWTGPDLQAWAATDTLERTTKRGPVSARVHVSPAKPRLGDALTLTLEVNAEAQVELFMPEFGHALDRFTIVDFLPRESLDPQGRTVTKQRYTLQLPMSGKQTIPPFIIEFVDHRPGHRPAPEGEDAYELLTERIPFEVASVIPKGAGDALKPPLGPLGARNQPGKTTSWLWLLLPIVVVAAPFGWRYWLRWRDQSRQRSAFDIAHSQLAKLMAQPRPGPEAMDGFFVELSGIIRRYLEDRFQLRAPERTTEEFLDLTAGSPDLTAEHRGFLHQFLAYADRVKFARHLPKSDQVDQALAAAERFLTQTQRAANARGGGHV